MDFAKFKQLIKESFPEFSVEFRNSGFEDRYVADIGFVTGDQPCIAELSYDTFHNEFSAYLEVEGHRLTQDQAISAMRSLLNGTTPEGGSEPVTFEDPNRPLRLGDRVTHVDRDSPHWFHRGTVVGFVGICPQVYVDSPINGSARLCRPERVTRVDDARVTEVEDDEDDLG